ncbi:MAG: trypsin-like peptidase domain-containing protein [Holophagales bacterium]|jgi:S1-C subfamily serine protease|nr:trypsin-like peptidase domain-containing protein [Holophagales bacterium]
MLIARGCLLAVFLTAALYPQGVLERSHVRLPEDERKAIEDARRNAKPRPFTVRKTPLSESEKERVRAFETAKDSVVRIIAPGIDRSTGSLSQGQHLGTGVIWDESGHIVTSYNLVSEREAGAERSLAETKGLLVQTSDSAEYSAKLVGTAPESGLALIKVDVQIKGVKPINLGRSADLAVGQSVLALGNPFGYDYSYDYSLTSGLVSALNRVIPSSLNTPINGVIQTDAAINRGNFGGPLLNCKGQMVGLNTAFLTPTGWNAGLNYAIPTDTVVEEIARMLGKTNTVKPLSPLTLKEFACASVFDRVNISVVGIYTKERYRDFRTGNEVLDSVGSGSGVLWDTEGHILTNFHVVVVQDSILDTLKVADIITVATCDNNEIMASVVGVRPDIDIAVLKLNHVPENLRPIPIGTTSGLIIGQSVLALGNPFGINQTLTGGIISALNRTIDSPTGKPIKGVLQTDAAINPGSSGGPLLDLEGRMIGINTMIISSTGINANVGFAIPVDLILREIKDITTLNTASSIQASRPSPEDQNRAAVFKSAKDAVVFVSAETEKPYSSDDNWIGNISRIPPMSGTGIVWDNRGHIVTAYSTVIMKDISDRSFEAERLTVTLADGNTYRARIIGRSFEYNIAVLRVFAPFKDLRPLPLARAADLKVGQDLFALGNPFGMDHSLSAGILSAERDLEPSSRGMIQTDAAINPGNRGGPMLDSEGNLVGMGFFIEGGESHSGINLALSTSTLNRIVPILLAKGQVERPILGFDSVADLYASRIFKVEKGVLIQSVAPDSPAFRAGLRGLQPSKTAIGAEIGDVIVGLRGKPIDNQGTLWDLLEQEPSGATLSFDVLRNGKRIKVVVKPDKR